MPDREKVIKRLEEVIAEAVYPDRPRKFMMSLELAEDALALLKAQEARVMTVDEVRSWSIKQRVDREPILIEMRDGFRAWIVSDEYWDLPIETGLTGDVYGKTWRCWTSRPTDAQMEAIPWN